MFQVVIIEDDKLMSQTLRKIISETKHFHVIGEFSDGLAAIDFCKKEAVNLVFCDISLPGMNGLEVGKRIMEENFHAEICMMSILDNANFMQKLLEMNVRKYLLKPFSKIELKSYLQQYAERYKIRGNSVLEEVEEELKINDFLANYRLLKQAVDQIFEQTADDMSAREWTLESLGEIIMSKGEDNEGTKKQKELFPLQKCWLENSEVVKLWAFRVLNNAFQKNSVRRYVILEQIFLYLEQHLKEEINLAQIVEKCAISQGYLSRIFRERFGITVMEYIRIRKIEMAKTNLIFTNYNMEEIAHQIGVNDGSYLSKIFKKEEQISMKEYRKKFGIKN